MSACQRVKSVWICLPQGVGHAKITEIFCPAHNLCVAWGREWTCVHLFFCRCTLGQGASSCKERVVLPLNPARVGCQLVFALGLSTALGGADHRVCGCLIPEREPENTITRCVIFRRTIIERLFQKLNMSPQVVSNTNDSPSLVSLSVNIIWLVVATACLPGVFWSSP